MKLAWLCYEWTAENYGDVIYDFCLWVPGKLHSMMHKNIQIVARAIKASTLNEFNGQKKLVR